MRIRMRLAAGVTAVLAIAALGACSDGAKTETNASGDSEVVQAGDLGAFDLKPGNCVVTTSIEDENKIDKVPAVPCTEPHDAEVTSQETSSLTSYDQEALTLEAETKCQASLSSYTGTDWANTTLETYYLTPTEDGWVQRSDREITCMAWDPSGSNLTESLKGNGANYPLPEGTVKKTDATLAAGDCIDSANLSDYSMGYYTTACTANHDLEIIGVAESTVTDFDEQSLQADAEDKCMAAFETYVGIPYEQSSLDLRPIPPTSAGWSQGDRQIICMVMTDPSSTSVAGTAQ